jgi:glutathione S-transferase
MINLSEQIYPIGGANMIKIWGRTDSSNVQKVLWCCGELGIEFERVDWGGKFGGNNFVLWESNSIMRYLNAKYGNRKLLPSSPEGMASANRWMDWQLSTFNATIVPLFWNLVRTPPDKRDPKAVQAALEKTGKAWQLVEKQLAQHRFLAGEEFSLGDIPLGVWAYRWFSLPIERPEQANITRWYNQLKQRKPYQTYIMIPLS